MTLSDAYDLMDLLLDKADQPYFTTDEKNKFLDLAISDFINYHYQRLDVDEDSRRALSGCKHTNVFEIDAQDIFTLNHLNSDGYPEFKLKYHSYSGDNRGYFTSNGEYVLPKRHLYLLQVSISTYDKLDVYNGQGGLQSWYSAYGLTSWQNAIDSKFNHYPVKIVSLQEFYELEDTDDPFKKPMSRTTGRYSQFSKKMRNSTVGGRNPHQPRYDEQKYYCTYSENKLIFNPSNDIFAFSIKTLTLPTISSAFTASGSAGGTYQGIQTEVFNNHHQKQIVQIAVEKMTKTDVGLMTPPAPCFKNRLILEIVDAYFCFIKKN